MKSLIMVFILVGVLLIAHPVFAFIIDDGEYFKDTETEFTWMDLTRFFGESYNEMLDSLGDFQLANEQQVKAMHLSAGDDFDYVLEAMGGKHDTVTFSHGLPTDVIEVLGIYKLPDLSSFGAAGAGKYTWDGGEAISGWGYTEHLFSDKDKGIDAFDKDMRTDGLGLWAVKTAHTPEPTNFLLLGSSLAFLRRRFIG